MHFIISKYTDAQTYGRKTDIFINLFWGNLGSLKRVDPSNTGSKINSIRITSVKDRRKIFQYKILWTAFNAI